MNKIEEKLNEIEARAAAPLRGPGQQPGKYQGVANWFPNPDVPTLVQALRRAAEQLYSVSRASVMNSRDTGSCIVEAHKGDSEDALADILRILEGK